MDIWIFVFLSTFGIFKLRPEKLEYYAHEGENKARGSICLASISSLEESGIEDTSFVIHLGNGRK